MRKRQEKQVRNHVMLITTFMFVTGLIFLCYMGSTLIRSTRKYQQQTFQMAQIR